MIRTLEPHAKTRRQIATTNDSITASYPTKLAIINGLKRNIGEIITGGENETKRLVRGNANGGRLRQRAEAQYDEASVVKKHRRKEGLRMNGKAGTFQAIKCD